VTAVGFVVALPEEAAPLLGRKPAFGQSVRLPSGHWLSVCGAGPQNAKLAAEFLVSQGVDGLISWGCAGSLVEPLNPGHLLIPDRVIAADGAIFQPDPYWRNGIMAKLSSLPFSISALPLAESSTVVANQRDKRVLHSDTFCAAVDMETAAIAKSASEARIPFVALRAIADSSNMEIPHSVLSALNQRGDVRLPRLMLEILKSPGEIKRLINLGSAFKKAIETLSELSSILPQDLCLPTHKE
jgi:adenosylhomocysteine nucleosidase